ncbi:hypothetical protein NG798_21520 [Ancylothrix sp. C2]|uniref:hypothetical protein n=1 Tax=Ancylothrix sp. D3o TaxID=2953691 RepID=UPI0021BAF5BC|nr:hypothetical protein [Ancylothrix sp. D3o]MCT7952380.1 hypothetical protein [Ancylothrix sp. D3o]
MARDPAISDIFYYFEQFSSLQTGRTIGRKIGVMQEVMLRKYLMQSPAVAERILLEHSVEGLSGATHKLEFLVCNLSDRLVMPINQPIQYGGIELQMVSGKNDSAKIVARWLDEDNPVRLVSEIKKGATFNSKPLLLRLRREGLVARLIEVSSDYAELALLEPAVPLATIESKRVGAQRFSSSDKLGAGIQTIEKAKQAALVAIDADLRFNGTVKPQAVPQQLRRYLSIVVLGNGVHWERKSRRVLLTYVDHVYLVPDTSIIRYCDYVRNLSQQKGEDFLQFYMDYFSGMTTMKNDNFQVDDDDFVALEGDSVSLLTVVEQHITNINPI